MKHYLKLFCIALLSLSFTLNASAGDFTPLISVESAAATMEKAKEKEKVPRSKCPDCKGTGRVKAGDGVTIVWRECESCYDDSVGEKPGEKPEAKPEVKAERRTRIMAFTANWCGPCQQEKRDVFPLMKQAGWQIDETPQAHIQVIDVDQHPDLMRKYNALALPHFIVVRDGEVVKQNGVEVRRQGYQPANQLASMLNDVINAKNPKAKTTLMTPADLRQWCKTYTGEVALVEGMTYEYHLTDPAAKEHHLGGPFQKWQLQGLTLTELQKVHGGQHSGKLTPTGPVD